MVVRRETLRSKSSIRALFQKGKRVSKKPLTLCFKKNGLEEHRFLFCTDKSSQNAVQRNRVKRVLRAALRDITILCKHGFDIAIISSYSFTEMQYSKRIEFLGDLIQKIPNE